MCTSACSRRRIPLKSRLLIGRVLKLPKFSPGYCLALMFDTTKEETIFCSHALLMMCISLSLWQINLYWHRFFNIKTHKSSPMFKSCRIRLPIFSLQRCASVKVSYDSGEKDLSFLSELFIYAYQTQLISFQAHSTSFLCLTQNS